MLFGCGNWLMFEPELKKNLPQISQIYTDFILFYFKSLKSVAKKLQIFQFQNL